MIRESSIMISYYPIGKSQCSFNRFEGLQDFKAELDGHYCSIIKKREVVKKQKNNDLIIEISINKNMEQSLGSNASQQITKINYLIQPFIKAYREFKLINPSVDIEELIISFKNCSIIIYRVNQNSVYNQLENILDGISEHCQMLKLNNQEVPFEIFIPIYSEPPVVQNIALNNFLGSLNIGCEVKEDEYYKYWGLSYMSTDDTYVFDIKQKTSKIALISAY